MNITTRQLQCFIAVARTQSFTRAAEEIFITQAGLSLMLKDLETQVGARLFDRTTRSVQLTLAGATLLPVAQRLVNDWQEATAGVGRLAAQARQLLTVAATPLVAATVLPDLLRSFARQQPQATVRVIDVDRARILELVESGEVDAGMGAFFKPLAGIDRRPLATFSLVRVAAAAPGARKRAAAPAIAWAALEGETLLSLPVDNPIQRLVDAHLRTQAVKTERGDTLNNLQTMVAMVEAGRGSAILPSFVAPACQRHAVLLQALDAPRVPVDFLLVRKKGREQAPIADVFANALQQHIQNIAGPVS